MTRSAPALTGPLCSPLDGPVDIDPPNAADGRAQRAAFRSLEYMQKEAVVTGSRTNRPWRLASDEGPYLDASDLAPNPLAILGTGMVGSYLAHIEALAERRDVELEPLELVLDNRYTQQGSALKGTMTGSALPPHLQVRVDDSADPDAIASLAADAVERSPVTAWLAESLPSRFALCHSGERLAPDRVAGLVGDPQPDPADLFASLPPVAEASGPPRIHHTGRDTEPWTGDDAGYTGPDYSTMRDEHDRTLHLRFSAVRRDDGGIEVTQRMYSPLGSVFELVTDPDGDQAPSPLTYVAAGIGFCFMTQLGRQAALRDVELATARMIQDTRFGDAGSEVPATPAPVETHLHLETGGDTAFVRTLLDMAEQTCYAHAACRQADLEPTVSVDLG